MDVLSGLCTRPERGHGTAVPAAGGAAAGGGRKAVRGAEPGGCGEAYPATACGRARRVSAPGVGGGGPVLGGMVSGSRVDGLESVGLADGAAPLSAGDQGADGRGSRAAALGRLAGDSPARSPG